MRLGFDLDNVIIHYPPIAPDWVFDTLYKSKSHDSLTYRIPGKLEQKGRKILHLPFLRQPIKKNLTFLHKIHEDRSNELFLISSRFQFLKKTTFSLIKRYGLSEIFQSFYFNFTNEQPHIFKDRIIKQEKIDRYIDDDMALVTYLAKNNSQCIFFWYNRMNDKQILPNLFATTEIETIIK